MKRSGLVVAAMLVALALVIGDGSAVAYKASPPNVVGLKLPSAEARLRAAGWIPRPFNTDTLFGIVVKRHYTVCHEYKPIGRRVRLLAQKYGC
jgi:hypothetical protein